MDKQFFHVNRISFQQWTICLVDEEIVSLCGEILHRTFTHVSSDQIKHNRYLSKYILPLLAKVEVDEALVKFIKFSLNKHVS